MSKGKWKPETKAKHTNRKPEKPLAFETDSINKPLGDQPPPLPPFGGSPAYGAAEPLPAADPNAGAHVIFDESKIKAGLGTAFCSTVKGFAAILNHLLRNSRFEVEFEPVEPELGGVWAEFAFPVLKLHLPDLEKNPHLVLVMMTGLILSGKIRFKTKEVKPNVGPNTGNTPEKTSEAVA